MNASQKTHETYFNYIGSITLPLGVVQMCYHQGECEADCRRCMESPEVKAELAKIEPDKLRMELSEYGVWDEDQLSDHQMNLIRILWIASGNIQDELHGLK